jgi:hypothetical protein
MTDAQTAIAARIAAQCVAGTPNNPGLPQALAEIVAGQSYNETNGWASDFYVNNNNCFGYECSSSSSYQNGCSTANADNGVTVGNYDSVEDSTKEMVDWIYRRVADGQFPSDLTTITTPTQYTYYLTTGAHPYFTSSAASYAARIQSFLTQAGNFFRKH